jgi:hypothetical protein
MLNRATFVCFITEEDARNPAYRIENKSGHRVEVGQKMPEMLSLPSSYRPQITAVKHEHNVAYAWDDLTAEPPFELTVSLPEIKKSFSVPLDDIGYQSTVILKVQHTLLFMVEINYRMLVFFFFRISGVLLVVSAIWPVVAVLNIRLSLQDNTVCLSGTHKLRIGSYCQLRPNGPIFHMMVRECLAVIIIIYSSMCCFR